MSRLSHLGPSPRGSLRRRAALAVAAASAGVALGAIGLNLSTAHAVLVPKDGTGGGSTGSAPTKPAQCPSPPSKWPSSPRLVFHVQELTDSGANLGTEILR